MRLRLRLLLLIALLLAGVLAGSFAWIFSDLRASYSADLETSLESAVAAFQAGEGQRFRTLEVMAGSLESSPSFRNVLRQTDQATLLDFAQSSAKALQIDLLLVCDEQGRVKARTPNGSTATHPATSDVTAWAGATPALRHYWWLDGTLYQGATVPLLDSQDYIDGYLSVAYRMDAPMLERLARELDSDLELRSETSTLSAPSGGLASESLRKFLSLGADHAKPGVAELTIARSLAPIEAVVGAARLKLLGLGSAAFLLALAASFPLVGRIANPLEALQKAEAEMAAIFSASLDGLVAFDDVGRVTMANPAAGVALGRESVDLVGTPLFDLLPEPVVRELTITPAGVEQQADYERAGHLYKLHRSFVRASGSMKLGSILLFHDVTEERQRERRVSRFLAHLCAQLEIPESPRRVRVGLATLAAWSHAEPSSENDSSALDPILSNLVEELQSELAGDRPCHYRRRGCEGETVAMTARNLRLLMEILLDNAASHGAGAIILSAERVGGSLQLVVEDRGDSPPRDLDACLEAPGLGLKVAARLSSQAQGQLEIGAGPGGGTRAVVHLPRGRG